MTDTELQHMADMVDAFEEFQRNLDKVDGDIDQLSEGEQRLFWIMVQTCRIKNRPPVSSTEGRQ